MPFITLSPAGAPAGTTVSLTINGQNTTFGPRTLVTFDGDPIGVEATEAVTEQLVMVTVSIPAGLPPGTVLVEVDEDIEDSSGDPLIASFNVLDAGLVASITINPSMGMAGNPVPLELIVTGENTRFAEGATDVEFYLDGVPLCPDPMDCLIDVTNLQVQDGSSTVLTLDVAISAEHPTEIITLVVQTDLGGGEVEIAAGAFGVSNPADAGTITVSPTTLRRGDRSSPLTIRAEGNLFFDEVTTRVEFATPGITVRGPITWVSLEQVVVNVDVGPLAPLGPGLVLEWTGSAKAFSSVEVVDRTPPGVAETIGAGVRAGYDGVLELQPQSSSPLDPNSGVEMIPGAGLESITLMTGMPPLVVVEVSRGFAEPFAPFFIVVDTTAPPPLERLPAAIPVAAPGPPEIAQTTPANVGLGVSGADVAIQAVGTSFVAGVTVAELVPAIPPICGNGACEVGEDTCVADCPTGAAVAVVGLSVTAVDAATVTLDVDAMAAPGPAYLRLTTAGEVADGLLYIGNLAVSDVVLVPDEIPLGRTRWIDVLTEGVDVTLATPNLSAMPGDLDIVGMEVLSSSRARVMLASSAAASTGAFDLELDDGGLPVSATVTVTPGTPVLGPPAAPLLLYQGDILASVELIAHFTAFDDVSSPTTTAAVVGIVPTVDPTAVFVEELTVTAVDRASALISVGANATPGMRPILVRTDSELVAAALTVVALPKNPLSLPAPGNELLLAGTIDPTTSTSPAVLYEVVGTPGDVVAFTASATTGTLDPTLRLLAADGVTVLAENDNADFCTEAAELTFALDSSDPHYLRVGAETAASGSYSFRVRVLDAPRTEVEPNDDWMLADDLETDPVTSALVVRGAIDAPDDVDYFAIEIDSPGPLSFIVIEGAARRIVDHLGAVPDLVVEVLGMDGEPLGGMTATLADDRPSPYHSFDPRLAFGIPAAGPYLVRVSSYAETTGPYLLNLRGPIVINEVFHNPQGLDEGTFVELAGFPGLSLDFGISIRSLSCSGSPCTCTVDATVGVSPEDLMGYSFDSSGLFVIGDIASADVDLGCNPPMSTCPTNFSNLDATVVELLVDPDGTSETLLDRVSYAAFPTACPGAEAMLPAPNPPDSADTSIGRGLGLDSDSNGNDFLEQLCPSPGAPNVTRF